MKDRTRRAVSKLRIIRVLRLMDRGMKFTEWLQDFSCMRVQSHRLRE
jgi:hypothetical protein